MIAPLPFDAVADDVVISGAQLLQPVRLRLRRRATARTRTSPCASRPSAIASSDTSSDSKVAKLGVRGPLFGSEWNYDFMVGYSRLDQTNSVSGYLYQPGLAGAFGPSFLNADGVVQCGTAAAPIALGQCTPVNIFNLADPAQVTALEHDHLGLRHRSCLHLEAGVVRGGRQDVHHAGRRRARFGPGGLHRAAWRLQCRLPGHGHAAAVPELLSSRRKPARDRTAADTT